MVCLGGDFIDGEQQRRKQQGPPPWLQSFLDSEDYFSDCSLNCFRGSMYKEFGERLRRPHWRRYFCTECSEESVICLGGIIERHLRHRVLKVREVMGVEGPVVKAGDIETLLNISYIVPHSSASVNDGVAYIKLKTLRRSVWGAGCKQEVPCFECLQLASTDYNHKYCSIKCAYSNTIPTSTTHYYLDQPTIHAPSVFEPEPVPQRNSASPAKQNFSALTFHSLPSLSKGWLGRMSKNLNVSSWKKRTPIKKNISLIENICPSATPSQDLTSSCEKSKTSPVKESHDHRRSSKDPALDQIHLHGLAPRQTLDHEDKRKSQNNETVEDCSPHESSQIPRDSWSKSATGLAVRPPRSVKGMNLKAGPVTSIYRRTLQMCCGSKLEVQEKWRSFRSWVLNSPCMACATYTSAQTSKKLAELTAAGGQAPQDSPVPSGLSKNLSGSTIRTSYLLV